MKHILKSAYSITILFITFNLSAQKWVEMMNDSGSNFYDIQKEFNAYWQYKKIDKGKGWKQFKRWEAFMEPRVYPKGRFDHNATLKAWEQ
jgi:hypothetical protein